MAGALTAQAGAVPGRAEPPRLAPLRDDLQLTPGPVSAEGAPTWTLYDPAANRFFRIGWLEMEMLTRWGLGTADQVVRAIAAETTIQATQAEVQAFEKFLAGGGLLRLGGAATTEMLKRQVEARRLSPFMWILKNYLFVRIPLLRPDGLLARLQAPLAFAYSRPFLLMTMAAALLGLFLVARQWDVFLHAFPYLFTAEGMVASAIALAGAKALHEMGHAMMAHRFGCRVHSMGVALLVMWPVLYTDTTDAWRLPSRRKRLAIGAAGMAVELALAAWMTLLWSFLPDGALRSAVFVLATTTWIMTLAVNLSPFLRFDGYFLLSDGLDVPNLHERAFALARWWLREALFSFGDPPPEMFAPGRGRLLIAFAIGTWIYRLFLFLGIALLVYHLFFKLLGLFLFAVEIWWFILRPVMNEIVTWIRRRGDLTLNRRSAVTLGGLGLLLLVLFVPWGGTVRAPAMLVPTDFATLHAPRPARIETLAVAEGQEVAEGQILLTLSSPDLAWQIADAERRVAALQAQMTAQTTQADLVQHNVVGWSELREAAANLEGLRAEAAELQVRAPVAGRVAQMPDGLRAGGWVAANEPLVFLAGGGMRVEGFVAEDDLARIAPGASASFIPDDAWGPSVPLTLDGVADTSTRLLDRPELASDHGGPIAVRRTEKGMVAEQAIYRVRLSTVEATAPADRSLRGRIAIAAKRESIAGRFWRIAIGVLVRESGF